MLPLPGRKIFRICTFTARTLLRGFAIGLFVCVIIFSMGNMKNSGELRTAQDSTVIELKGRNGKILVQQVDGRKVFSIKGLPSKKIKEHRKFFQPTTLPAKIKAALAPQVEATYMRRKKRLEKSCGRTTPRRWTDAMQLIAVPEKDLSVCVVQKAASSSWHRLVYKLREPNGTWNGLCHQLNRDHAKQLPADERERLMNAEHGIRVITVRHPFARLISGWNDKLSKNHLSDSTRILTTLPGIEDYIQRSEPDEDHIIAFKDFAQYLVDTRLKGIDVHFKTVEQLCRPCRYPYDFVSKTETSQKNLWWVLDHVGAEMPSFSKHTASGSGENNINTKSDPWEAEKKVMTAFFKSLPIETVIHLKDLYEDDFDRFGYTFDVSTMTAGDIVD